jgi:hypothetical protein
MSRHRVKFAVSLMGLFDGVAAVQAEELQAEELQGGRSSWGLAPHCKLTAPRGQ